MRLLSKNDIDTLDPRALCGGNLPECCRTYEIEAGDCRLPRRPNDSHKYSYGRALIIAGSTGYTGAPCLAATACERSGAGLTTLLVPESIYHIAAIKADSAVVRPLPCDENGQISAAALDTILPLLNNASACLIGPGLGLSDDITQVVSRVISSSKCPLVLDADGINAIAGHIDLLDKAGCPLLLTPHEGEFMRLGGDVSHGRLIAAHSYAAEHGCTLILKGYRTLVCDGETVNVNTTGGPALAKGGSGDVLAGILTALLAQGFDSGFSARCAVYLHGLAGDVAAEQLGEYCLVPSDIVTNLPAAFRTVCER